MNPDSDRFNRWLTFVFDHPEREDDLRWFDVVTMNEDEFLAHANSEASWTFDRSDLARNMTRLFYESGAILPRFTPRQAGEGLRYLSELLGVVLTPGIVLPGRPSPDLKRPLPSWELRRDLIRSNYYLFADYFAKTPDIHPQGDWACELWWENFPLPTPFFHTGVCDPLPPESQAYYDEVIDVMGKILALNDLGCYISVYFRLDRWKDSTGKAQRLIERYKDAHEK